jgi:hypothetical protein
MEEHILEIIEELVNGRNIFFDRCLRIIPHQNRASTLSRFMLNEGWILEVMNRVYQNSVRNGSTTASALVTFSLPSGFSDPVVVSLTSTQIEGALENIPSSNSNCAICQDAISSGGCRIRSCRHEFHRNCVTNWFGMSVRCPVCRHDIREPAADDSNQTPSDGE